MGRLRRRSSQPRKRSERGSVDQSEARGDDRFDNADEAVNVVGPPADPENINFVAGPGRVVSDSSSVAAIRIGADRAAVDAARGGSEPRPEAAMAQHGIQRRVEFLGRQERRHAHSERVAFNGHGAARRRPDLWRRIHRAPPFPSAFGSGPPAANSPGGAVSLLRELEHSGFQTVGSAASDLDDRQLELAREIPLARASGEIHEPLVVFVGGRRRV